MNHRGGWKIVKSPNGDEHQAHKKKRSEGQNALNHFALENQVNEVARHKKCLADGDEQRQADVDCPVRELDVRRQNGDHRSEQQGVKHEKVTPDVSTEMVCWMCVAHGYQS